MPSNASVAWSAFCDFGLMVVGPQIAVNAADWTCPCCGATPADFDMIAIG